MYGTKRIVGRPTASQIAYRNRGDGSFEDVAAELGVTGPRQSFPACFWDFDNDGNLDLFVSSYTGDRGGLGFVAASYQGFPGPWELARLYRSLGGGRFEDVAAGAGLTRLHLPMGSNFGDLDADGFLDFYVGTGYPDYEAVMPNVLYRSLGGERFVDVSLAAGFGHLQKGHAVVFAEVEVYWPTTDNAQTFTDVGVDRLYRVVEGVPELEAID